MNLHQERSVAPPSIGLLIMGRKRPGFDPEWGATITSRIQAFLESLPWTVHSPPETITDTTELTKAVDFCRARGVTVLVIVQPTISDGRLAPLLSRLWEEPLLLWATTEKQEGSMISANSLVGTHAMAATLRHLGHAISFAYGHPDDPKTQEALQREILTVHAAQNIRGKVFGLIGYHAPGFIDFHADPVFLAETLGSHLYHVSTTELISRVEGYSSDEIAGDLQTLKDLGLPSGEGFSPGAAGELEMQARYSRAFRDIYQESGLDALAFRCWPDLPNQTGHWPYLALAQLVSQGMPIAMEGDLDGAICSRIAESLGIGPVYLTDWLEHTEKTATIWHTGAAPFQMCEPPGSPGAPRLGLQFNNLKPTVVEATIRAGMEVTLFRLWRFRNRYYMTALEGKTAPPLRDLLATNGLFETESLDIRLWFEEMIQAGMPHHLCVVQGRQRDILRRTAQLMGATFL
ncbi:L-fucose isomerase [Alkalispirochaeta americana]|uniref:L-fucose isomerase n=1 Tax=Alkalispirochaeta americana TaxID=159291 RepID=A0A1N6VEV6_9SPIO|nr:sugar isomerase [Alkalispirochaeta americana]SIQ76297.1 L-fucose isomerase [Alkalispirochaeta americana]